MSAQEFYLSKLEPLMGGKVTGIIKDDTEFFGLQIEVGGKKKNVWLLQDDEGNGPGSFSIEEVS